MMSGNFNILVLLPVFATLFVFLIVSFGESMRLEIPLSYGGIRGVGGRYPLRFFYVSNIPVILASAMLANVQMFAGVFGVDINSPSQSMSTLQKVVYTFASSVTLGNLQGFLLNIFDPTMWGQFTDPQVLMHLAIYLVVFISLCVLFGKFWVSTTGLESEAVAKQIQDGGMQIPGFRRDRKSVV